VLRNHELHARNDDDLHSVDTHSLLAVWFSGNALISINVVTLHRAQLVRGWVIILGQVNHIVAQPVTHVNSAWAIPLWVGAVSTSEI